jgi:hypothetical protein
MKYLLIVCLFCATACKGKFERSNEIVIVNEPAEVHTDTVMIDPVDGVLTTYIDSIPQPVPIPCDSSFYKEKSDSLRVELLISQYKVERVKYYLAIVDRNPSQLKFLRSWIRRAVN